MILVTGATGKTARNVIEALGRRDEPVRALARSSNVHELEADGVETIQADMLDPQAMRAAMDGVRAAVFIGPTLNTQEVAMGRNVIDAAVAAGVPRFLQLSVAHPQIETLVNHQSKLATEDYLVGSGLEFTILQPMHYMQNYDPLKASETGALRIPYDISLLRSYVDLADVGEVAAITLTEPGHVYATYPLSGADLISVEQIAALISQRAGVAVSAEQITPAAFAEMVSGSGNLSQYAIDGIHRLFTYYSFHPLLGNPNVLGWLLGRPPTTFEQYVDRCFATETPPPPPAWIAGAEAG
ncbi:MAG TPA: NmrA family NAD(P)-binding protein [Solirubrobacterales bacterium]|nr:NmrA family NAD(P)-binding protein [Solirubrobacterales bacterium]